MKSDSNECSWKLPNLRCIFSIFTYGNRRTELHFTRNSGWAEQHFIEGNSILSTNYLAQNLSLGLVPVFTKGHPTRLNAQCSPILPTVELLKSTRGYNQYLSTFYSSLIRENLAHAVHFRPNTSVYICALLWVQNVTWILCAQNQILFWFKCKQRTTSCTGAVSHEKQINRALLNSAKLLEQL